MNTIRKKISVGFIAVSILLICAIAINIFEIKRLGSRADRVIDEGVQHTEYATQMLNALQKQNRAVLNMIILGNGTTSAEFSKGSEEFSKVLSNAMKHNVGNRELGNIQSANKKYLNIVELHSSESSIEENREWFMNTYVEGYYALDDAIKKYMTTPQESAVAEHVSTLEDNIYKTITPSVLTLLITILILALFYYFIDTYYTKPVRKISRALDNYAKNKVPYLVKIEEKSELSLLNDNIAELINHNKKQ